MYDPKSKHAEDFINHEEILENYGNPGLCSEEQNEQGTHW